MALSKPKNVLDTINDIVKRRPFISIHPKRGAIMMHCHLKLIETTEGETYEAKLDRFLEEADVEVYYPKNKSHFWMGKVTEPHITVHHGFELQGYENQGSGKEGWKKDINDIIDALEHEDEEEQKKKKNPHRTSTFRERLLNHEMDAWPMFFPANPMTVANGEDNYFTVILKAKPTPEVKAFRDAVLKVFPHTQQFPLDGKEWEVHASICTVPNEEEKDKLMAKLKGTKLVVDGLKDGYNIKRD